MCLVSNINYAKAVNKDTYCYKVLILVNEKYYSPYKDFLFSMNELYTDTKSEIMAEFMDKFLIGQGFFHCLMSEPVAERFLERVQGELRRANHKGKLVIKKALIPKDTPIFVGEEGDIATKSIMIIDD